MGSLKAMKPRKVAQTLTKTGMVEALAEATELNKKDCAEVLKSLAVVVALELTRSGKVVIPGVVMLKQRFVPARAAGERVLFGKLMTIAAKQSKTVVAAYPAAAVNNVNTESRYRGPALELDSEEGI